jgi:hypothetical protein
MRFRPLRTSQVMRVPRRLSARSRTEIGLPDRCVQRKSAQAHRADELLMGDQACPSRSPRHGSFLEPSSALFLHATALRPALVHAGLSVYPCGDTALVRARPPSPTLPARPAGAAAPGTPARSRQPRPPAGRGDRGVVAGATRRHGACAITMEPRGGLVAETRCRKEGPHQPSALGAGHRRLGGEAPVVGACPGA